MLIKLKYLRAAQLQRRWRRMSFTFCCCLRSRAFFNNLIHCNRASRRAWTDLLKIKTKHTHRENKQAGSGLRVWKIREANIFAQTLIGNCQRRQKDVKACVVKRHSHTHTLTVWRTTNYKDPYRRSHVYSAKSWCITDAHCTLECSGELKIHWKLIACGK